MTPRLATVLSARDWEANVVALARDTALVRLVLRAYQPGDIERHLDDIDVVVAGAETSWVTPAQIGSWRRKGLKVIGTFPNGDGPSQKMLLEAGVLEALPDNSHPSEVLHLARLAGFSETDADVGQNGAVVAVSGPRGAPGRTEIALALAWNWGIDSNVGLIDLDIEAPNLAIRTTRPPRPDLTDAAERVRLDGALDSSTVHSFGPVSLLVGSHRPGEGPLGPTMVDDVTEAATGAFEITILDLGPYESNHRLVKASDHAVLVVDGTPSGLVRGARVAAEWVGPPPALILNKVVRSSGPDSLAAARKWIGLDPVAVVRHRQRIKEASTEGLPPDWGLRKSLSHLEVPA